jgi:hypothetical protein
MYAVVIVGGIPFKKLIVCVRANDFFFFRERIFELSRQRALGRQAEKEQEL